MNIITLAFRRLTALFLALFVIVGFSPVTETHDVKDPESCKMNFSVLADIHMETISIGENRPQVTQRLFVRSLQDIKNNKTANDAVVFLGDNTMNGQIGENLLFYGVVETVKPAKRIYTVMGNHDTGNSNNEYNKKAKRFWDYYNGFADSNVTSPYYYYEKLDNCYFIFMASKSDSVNNPDISLEQIQWLDSVLAKAEADGLPAFVFNHYTPWHLTENGEELRSVITKHHNVFFMCGHTHTSKLNVSDFDADSHYFNLPKATAEPSGDDEGLGLQVEIYESKVTVRGRMFASSKWTDYEFNYDI